MIQFIYFKAKINRNEPIFTKYQQEYSESIEKAQQAKPDLVLMDIKLKGNIDGIEAGTDNTNIIIIIYI